MSKQETSRSLKFTDILLEDEENLQEKSKEEQKLKAIQAAKQPGKYPKKQIKQVKDATKDLCLPQIYKKWGGQQKLSFQTLTFLKYQHQRNLQILNPIIGSQMAKIAEEEDLEYRQESNEEAIDFSDELYKTVDSQNIQQLTELSEQEPQKVDKQKYMEILSQFLKQNKQAINKLKKYQIDLKNQSQDQVLEEQYELQIEDIEQKQQRQARQKKNKLKNEDQNEQFQLQPDKQLMEEQQIIMKESDDEEEEGLQSPQNITIQQQSQRYQKNEQKEIQNRQILNKIRTQIENMSRLQKDSQTKESEISESESADFQKNLEEQNFTITQQQLQEQKAQYLKDTQLIFQNILQQKQNLNLQEKDKELQEQQMVQSEESQQEIQNKNLKEAEKYILKKKEELQNQYNQILKRKLLKQKLLSSYSKQKISFDEEFEQKHISQQKEQQEEEQKEPLADIQLPGKFRYQDIYSLGQQVKSQKQTTHIKEFQLNTEKRAQERQQEELQDFSQQQSKFAFKKNLMLKTTQKKKIKIKKKTEIKTSQKEILQNKPKEQKEQRKEVRDITSLQDEKQKSLTIQKQQKNQETQLETFGEFQLDLEEKNIEKLSVNPLLQPDQALLTFESIRKTGVQQQSAQVKQHMQLTSAVKSMQSLYQEKDKESQIPYHQIQQATEKTSKPSFQIIKQIPNTQYNINVQERQLTPFKVEQSDVMINKTEIWNLQDLEIKQMHKEQEESQLVIIEQDQSTGVDQDAQSKGISEQQESTVQESQTHLQQIKRKKKTESQQESQEKVGQEKSL